MQKSDPEVIHFVANAAIPSFLGSNEYGHIMPL